MTERTLVMIKPNGVKKHLIGEVISRFEKSRLSVLRLEMKQISKQTAEKFYGEHKGKPFYEPLVDFMSSGLIVTMVIEGESAIAAVRAIAGATDPSQALAGTIRHNYGDSTRENVVHASDSPESASREIAFHFPI
jgi:nucleoside-diphosphate kinase